MCILFLTTYYMYIWNYFVILNQVNNYNGILVPVRTGFGLRRRGGKTYNISM